MELYLFIGLLGLIYILVFSGMTVLRREGLSVQFAIESLIITVIAVLLILVFGIPIHPVIFILLLYAITLRVRLLVDLANSFAKRGNYTTAEKLYSLAFHVWPDHSSKLIILVNRSVMLLQQGKLDEAIGSFNEVLDHSGNGNLGIKYKAAAHFNLGVAYMRQGNHLKATNEFNSVMKTWPVSIYAQRAQQALDRQQPEDRLPVGEKPAE